MSIKNNRNMQGCKVSVFSVKLFCTFCDFYFFCIDVAMRYLVHDTETKHGHCSLLTACGNLFLKYE